MACEIFFAQKAFIFRDEKLLLVRKSGDDPNQPGLLEVPGGRMRFGEDIDDHIRREVREEVGIEIVPGIPFYVWEFRVDRVLQDGEMAHWQIVALARLCEAATLDLSADARNADDYLSEMAWVSFSELNSYRFIPNMLPVIDAFLNQIRIRATPE